MTNIPNLTRRFERVFNKDQASILAESITEAYSDLVKTGDFNELKEIVRDIAVAQQELTVAQQRTEARVEELTVAQQELTIAQQRTEVKVEELTINVDNLTNNVDKLAQTVSSMASELGGLKKTVSGMAKELGGLSRTMSYALENETFRVLPAYLQKQFGITVQSRFVRTEIGDEELDFFAQGEQNGRPVCIIGESKLRVDERRRSGQEFGYIMNQLNRKAAVVQEAHPDCGIVRMLVTHYVRPSTRQLLEEEDVLIVQSFDWG